MAPLLSQQTAQRGHHPGYAWSGCAKKSESVYPDRDKLLIKGLTLRKTESILLNIADFVDMSQPDTDVS